MEDNKIPPIDDFTSVRPNLDVQTPSLPTFQPNSMGTGSKGFSEAQKEFLSNVPAATEQSFGDYLFSAAEADIAPQFAPLPAQQNILIPHPNFRDEFEFTRRGKVLPKYTKGYTIGLNNQDINYARQTKGEAWKNSLSKLALNVGALAISGTVGLFADKARSKLTGQRYERWEEYADEVRKVNDFTLPTYTTTAYDEKGLFGRIRQDPRMFLLDDFRQGSEFMLAALVQEVPWAILTGGQSFAATLPKAGLRMASRLASFTGRGALKATGRAGLRTAAKHTDEAVAVGTRAFLNKSDDIYAATIGGFNRALSSGVDSAKKVESMLTHYAWLKDAGSVLQHSRFMLTSGVFEAGVETFAYREEAVNAFILRYREMYGEDPDYAAWKKFNEHLDSSSKRVFWGNTLVTGVGNVIVLGELVGIGSVAKRVSRMVVPKSAGKAVITRGVKETAEKTIKRTITHTIRPDKGFKKYAFAGFSSLYAPITEGAQEGLQGTLTNWGLSYMAAKYDPEAARKNGSNMRMAWDALGEGFTSKEGFLEVGLGFILGGFSKMMGVGRMRAADTRAKGGGRGATVGSFFRGMVTNEYLYENKQKTAIQEQANEKLETLRASVLTPTQLRLARKLQVRIAMDSHLEAAKQAEESGDSFGANVLHQAAQLQYHKFMKELGMEDNVLSNMYGVIDDLTLDDVSVSGATEVELDGLKYALKVQVYDTFNRTKKAMRLSEAYSPVLSGVEYKRLQAAGFSEVDLQGALALQFLTGFQATDEINRIYNEISDKIGSDKFSPLSNFAALSPESLETVSKFNENAKRIEELTQERNSLYNIQSKSELQDEPGRIQATDRVREIEAELQSLAVEQETMNAEFQRANALQDSQVNTLYNPIEIDEEADTKGFLGLQQIAPFFAALNLRIGELESLSQNKEAEQQRKEEAATEANELRDLLEEAGMHYQVLDSLIHSHLLMTSRPFKVGITGKFGKFIKALGRPLMDEEKLVDRYEYIPEGYYVKLEDFLSENEAHMTERDIFRLRALHKMLLGISLNEQGVLTLDDVVDPVNTADWEAYNEDKSIYKQFVPGIQYRVENKIPLSRRQRVIYEENKGEIDREMAIRNVEVPTVTALLDSFRKQLDEVKITDSYSFADAIEKYINDIIAVNKELIKTLPNQVADVDYLNIDTFNELVAARKKAAELQDQVENATDEELDALEVELEEAQQKYDEIQTKINDIGLLIGLTKMNENGVMDTLSGLVETMMAAREAEQLSPEEIGIVHTANTMDGLEWEFNERGRAPGIGQIYTIGVSSRAKNKTTNKNEVTFHNVSLDHVLETLGVDEVTVVTQTKKNQEQREDKIPSTETYSIQNTDNLKRVEVTLPDGTEVVFTTDFNGNVVFEENQDNPNRLGNITFQPTQSLQRQYQPILFENENGEVQSMRSDFTFPSVNGKTRAINEQAARNVKEGDKLKVTVPLTSVFNTKLIRDFLYTYLNPKNSDETKSKKFNDLRRSLLMFLENSDSEITQVLKKLPIERGVSSSEFNSLKNLRDSVTQQVVELVDTYLSENPFTEQDYTSKGNLKAKSIDRVAEALFNSLGDGQFESTNETTVIKPLPGFANVTYRREGNTLVPVQHKFNKDSVGKVVTIGYLQDNQLVVRDSKASNKHIDKSYLKGYQKESYKGQTIPVVVLQDEQGRFFAYPVSTEENVVNKTNEFLRILEDPDAVNRAIAINNFLAENGLSLDEYGVLPSETLDISEGSKIAAITELSEKITVKSDLSEWANTESERNIADVLQEEATIDVDLNNRPFDAPKILLDLQGRDFEATEVEDGITTTIGTGSPIEVSTEIPAPTTQEAVEQSAKPSPVVKEHRKSVHPPMPSKTIDEALRQPMNLEQAAHMVQAWITSGFETLSDMYSALYDAVMFPDGMQLDSEVLEGLGFTDVDIDHWMDNPTEFQKAMFQMANELMDDDSVFSRVQKNPIDTSRATYTTDDSMLVSTQRQERTMSDTLGGIQNRDTFNRVVNSLPFPGYVEKFNTDAAFAEREFQKYSSMRPVASTRIENGQVVRKSTYKSATHILGDITVATKKQKDTLAANLRVLQDTLNREDGQTRWYDFIELVEAVVRDSETMLADLGIDVVGLSENIASKGTEIVSLLEMIQEFVEANSTLESIPSGFEALYNELFKGNANDVEFAYPAIPSHLMHHSPYHWVVVENPLSDNEMFETHGLLRFGDNLYLRIDQNESTDALVAQYLDSLQDTNSPVTAEVSKTAAKMQENGQEIDLLSGLGLLEQVEREIHEYLNRVAAQELGDIEVNKKKAMFNLLTQNEHRNTPMTQTAFAAIMHSKLEGGLSMEAVPMVLKQRIAQEKVKNSEEYKLVYSHFDVNNGVITFEGSGTETSTYTQIQLAGMEAETGLWQGLMEYAMATGSETLLSMLEVSDNITLTDEVVDAYYANFPQSLPQPTGGDMSVEGLMQTKSQADYMRVGDVAYKRIGWSGDTSIYSPMILEHTGRIQFTAPMIATLEGSTVAPMFNPIHTQGIEIKQNEASKTEEKKFDC